MHVYDHLCSGLSNRRQSRTNSNTAFLELHVCNLITFRDHPQRPDRLWSAPRSRRVKLTAISTLWWCPIKPRDKFLLHTLGVNYTPSDFIS